MSATSTGSALPQNGIVIPRTYSNETGDRWAHSGVAFHPSLGFLLADASGSTLLSVTDGGLTQVLGEFPSLTSMHGIMPSGSEEDLQIWVADVGYAWNTPHGQDSPTNEWGTPGVFRIDLATGHVTVTCDPLTLPAPLQKWRPSAIAEHDDRVWVADGYGRHVVHCFTRSGTHLWTVDGGESGTAFRCPHAVIVDKRGLEPRLLVLDRENERICAYNLAGTYLRDFGSDMLTSPTGAAIVGDRLVVTELDGYVAVFDGNDIAYCRKPFNGTGFPDLDDYRPHGIHTDGAGRLLISEWGPKGRSVLIGSDWIENI